MPKCTTCGSIEWQRACRTALDALLPINWRSESRALLHAPAKIIEKSWFQSVLLLDKDTLNQPAPLALPHQDALFDLILSPNILHQVGDFRSLLRESIRLLAPSGLLLLVFPSPVTRKQTEDWGNPDPARGNARRIFGTDFEPELAELLGGASLAGVRLPDPGTDSPQIVYIASKSPGWLDLAEAALRSSAPSVRFTPLSPGPQALATSAPDAGRTTTTGAATPPPEPTPGANASAGVSDGAAARSDQDAPHPASAPWTRPAEAGSGLSAPARVRTAPLREWARRIFDPAYAAASMDLPGRSDEEVFDAWWDAGRHAGHDPHRLFQTEFYLSQAGNAGVAAKDAFLQFLESGEEGLADPHPCFSMEWYRYRHGDRDMAHPWLDYLLSPRSTGRDPNWLFSAHAVNHILRDAPSEGRKSLLERYLSWDAATPLSPHPLLDLGFVARKYKIQNAGSHLYQDFWLIYRQKDIQTSAYFDPKAYRTLKAAAGHEALVSFALLDYILSGERLGIKPNPLFDAAWYRRIYGESEGFCTALEHYLLLGEKQYRQPNPAFDPRCYLALHPGLARAGVPPLQHYLAHGQREGRRPHFRFDPAHYQLSAPEAPPEALLEHFLQTGLPQGISPHPAVTVEPGADAKRALLAFLDPKAKKHDAIPGLHVALAANPEEGPPSAAGGGSGQAWLVDRFERALLNASRIAAEFAKRPETIARRYTHHDEAAGRRHADQIRAEFARSHQTLPLISVILPTRNRARVIRSAIISALGQTHADIELLVVDDGSTDGTRQLVEQQFDDPRLRYLPIPPSGVSAARNAGLRAARGGIIAYLDSDNYWEPHHIEITAKTMLLQGRSSAYSMIRIFNGDRKISFRGDHYDHEALLRENYIDMNAFIHDRSILDAGLWFDESLKRCVDWDFIIRTTAVSQPIFVPVLGCNYTEDEVSDFGRISTHEPLGDFFKVCQRNINIASHVVGHEPKGPCGASMIWPISRGEWPTARRDLWPILRHIARTSHELIIVNNGLPAEATIYLCSLAENTSKVRIINLWRSFLEYPAANLAAGIAKAEHLLFWHSAVSFEPNAVEALLGKARNLPNAVHIPLIVDTEGKVAAELDYASGDGCVLRPLLTGQEAPALEAPVRGVIPVTTPVLIKTAAFIQTGYDTEFYEYLGLADFALRHLHLDGMATALHLDCRMTAKAPLVGSPANDPKLREIGAFRDRWFGRGAIEPRFPDGFVLGETRQRLRRAEGWNLIPDMARGAGLAAPAVGRQVTFVIRCPMPSSAEHGAGEQHDAARAIGHALERAGHAAVIESDDAAESKASRGDIVLHLHARADAAPTPGRLNAIWIFTPPDQPGAMALDDFDWIFAASTRLCRHLHATQGIEARLLLPCSLYGPPSLDAIREIPAVRGRPLFAGSSGMRLRPMVLDALEMGIPLVIRGSDWEHFIPHTAIAGSAIPHADLPDWYGSAGVVLGDHPPAYRECAMLSHQVFDVAASGRPVLTDVPDETEGIFGDTLHAYREKEELPQLVQELAAIPPRHPTLLDTARRIQAEHGIEARVATILATMGIARR